MLVMTDRDSDRSHSRNTNNYDTLSYTGPNHNTFGYTGSHYSHAYNAGTDPSSHGVTTPDSSVTGTASQTPVGSQISPSTNNSMYSPHAPQQPLSPFTNPLYGGQHPPNGTGTAQYPTNTSLGTEYIVHNLDGRYIRRRVLEDYLKERLNQSGELCHIEVRTPSSLATI